MITFSRLQMLFDYNAESGIFRHKTGKIRFGKTVGKINEKGHRRIIIDTRLYYAHRLAWLYVYGVYPVGIIDHINGDPDDNRIANLREVNSWQNAANIRHTAANATGLIGVTPNGSGWSATIRHRNKTIYLGTFSIKEEAGNIYLAKRKALRGEFSAGYIDPLPPKPTSPLSPLVRQSVSVLTRERLAEAVSYNPDTGEFNWAAQPRYGRRRKTETPINNKRHPNGYLLVMVFGVRYPIHHLAWLWVHGRLPSGWLDHINGIRDDNRIANLREATPAENARNGKGWKRTGSGLKGAYPQKLRWNASIRVDRKLIYLGSFLTELEAHEAYVDAAKKHFGEFARAGAHVGISTPSNELGPIR